MNCWLAFESDGVQREVTATVGTLLRPLALPSHSCLECKQNKGSILWPGWESHTKGTGQRQKELEPWQHCLSALLGGNYFPADFSSCEKNKTLPLPHGRRWTEILTQGNGKSGIADGSCVAGLGAWWIMVPLINLKRRGRRKLTGGCQKYWTWSACEERHCLEGGWHAKLLQFWYLREGSESEYNLRKQQPALWWGTLFVFPGSPTKSTQSEKENV